MKRIEALIQPHRLSKVVMALHALQNFPGFTVVDANGQGRGRGIGGQFVYEPSDGLLYHARCCLIILCKDEEAEPIAKLIAKTACTGNKGDGWVTISDIAQAYRIREAGAL
jgi:nitrogen regulatory protein P-II 1